MLGEHPPLELHPPPGGGHVSRQHLSKLVLQEAGSVHRHVVVTIGNLREREGGKGRERGKGTLGKTDRNFMLLIKPVASLYFPLIFVK